MTDQSNQSPLGGYLFPLLPAGYWRDPAVMQAVCAGLDTDFESRRVACDALQASRYIGAAQGSDIDLLGALLDLPRLTVDGVPEGDEAYRARLPATVESGIQAITLPDLQAKLAALTGQLVQVTQGQRAARLDVVFFGYPPQGAAIVDVIKSLRAAGVDFSVVVRSGPTTGRVGTFRLGTTPLGGATTYIVLRAGILLSSGGSQTRVGTFRLGTQRLAANTAVSWS